MPTILRCLLAVIVVAGFSARVATEQSPDDAQLRRLIAAHQAASENGDLRGLVDIYSADAEIISGSGKVTRGREAIEADYRTTLASVGGTGATGTPLTESRVELVTIWRKEAGSWKAVYQRALPGQ